VLSREANNSNFVNTARDNAGINEIYICDNTFNDSWMYHYKNPTNRVGLVQSGSHHHLNEN
jgi:hypothetical protein